MRRNPAKKIGTWRAVSSRPIVKTSELLYMHKVILYRKIMTNEPRLGPNDQLCLPKGLQEVALYWAYAHDSVGQLKVGATQKRMKARSTEKKGRSIKKNERQVDGKQVWSTNRCVLSTYFFNIIQG